MSEDKRARLRQWLESGEARLQPLTFPQRELWEASAVPPADQGNYICCLLHVQGPITNPLCRLALQRVVDHQEALRVSFLPGKEAPLQMIRKTCEANLTFQELSAAEATPKRVEELAQESFLQAFDLVQGPLYRVHHLQLAADKHVLVFVVHHAIADGWTLGVFVQDLCAAYLQSARNIPGALPSVPMSYAGWGAAERAAWTPEELSQRGSFWKSNLEGSTPLFAGREKLAAGPTRLRRTVCRIPADLTAATKEMAKRSGATLFSTLLAAFRLTILKWSGKDDLVVGSPVANRGKQAVRETMGYFSGNAPLRGRVDPTRPFSATVRAVHEETVDAFANAMPFAELAKAAGDRPAPDHHPIYDVRFALQNHPMPDVALPGIAVNLKMRSTGTARFDLGCEITEEGNTLEVVWLFRPHLVSQEDIRHLDDMLRKVLEAGCRSPEIGIALLLNDLR